MAQAQHTKIVFLDCDGVVSPLIATEYFQKELMLRLKRIVQESGARIVLSSSWRVSAFGRGEVAKHLAGVGLPTFIDVTPDLPRQTRTAEILQWISKNREKYNIVNFVALDDIPLAELASDKEFFSKHAVCTNPNVGITEKDVEKALLCLSDSNNFT